MEGNNLLTHHIHPLETSHGLLALLNFFFFPFFPLVIPHGYFSPLRPTAISPELALGLPRTVSIQSIDNEETSLASGLSLSTQHLRRKAIKCKQSHN